MTCRKYLSFICKHLEFMFLVYICAKRKSKNETLIPALFDIVLKLCLKKSTHFYIVFFFLQVEAIFHAFGEIFFVKFTIHLISSASTLSLVCHIIYRKIILIYIHMLIMMEQISLLIILFSLSVSIQLC